MVILEQVERRTTRLIPEKILSTTTQLTTMTRFTLLSCVILLFVLVCIHKATSSCNMVWSGCNIVNDQCECSVTKACDNPYDYKDIDTCRAFMYSDVCKPNPCFHEGVCSQTKQHNFTCKCQGTGYYGMTCEIRCPKKLSKKIPADKLELGKACISI